MNDVLSRLKAGEILIADGAMGSLLMARAQELIAGKCPEYLNLIRLDILEDIARLYLHAGADIIQTNTFGGSPLKLANYSLDQKTEEINIAAVTAVRAAVNGGALVSGSCGPTGKILIPFGDTAPDMMKHAFTRQIKSLIEAGVDIICIETMSDIKEATLAVEAARSISKTIPVMATMTFEATPRGFFTIMGVTIPQAAKELEQAGASIIGSNCGNGIENMIKIAREFKQTSNLPILIQSNAGMPQIKNSQTFYPETPEFMAEKSRELKSAGVNIIGGCCGTTPEHISAIARAVRSPG